LESTDTRDDQRCAPFDGHLADQPGALADPTLEPITLEVERDGEVVDASDRVDLKD
jgi:hypothetical protein